MVDGIEKWEKTGVYEPVKRSPSPWGAPRNYEAFGESSNCTRLWLKTRPKGKPERSFPYSYLMEVVTDTWSIITLDFVVPWPRPALVQIQGQCLEPLVAAVMGGTAAWIQVFNDEWFNMPDDDAPLVRDILINTKLEDFPPDKRDRH